MSIIELQASVPSFLAAQRIALQTMQFCPPAPFVVGPLEILIDRIDIGPNAIRHNRPTSFPLFYTDHGISYGRNADGFQTQVVQEVTAHITTLNDIRANPNQPPATSLPVTGNLEFDLDFNTSEDECYFRIDFRDFVLLNLPPLPPSFSVPGYPTITTQDLLDWLRAHLQKALPTRTIPAGLSELTTVWAKFLNAGASVDTALQRIAFRAQIGGSSSYVANPGMPWSEFFNGRFANRTGLADWCVYIDSGLITEKIKVEVDKALDGIEVDNLQTFVGCNYSANQGVATFTTNVLGVYDLPDPLGTIVRDPHVTATISVPTENVLLVAADYGHVVETIHSFPIVEFLAPMLSQIAESMLQGVIDSALSDMIDDSDAPFCQKVAPTRIECTKFVRPPAFFAGARGILNDLLAFPDGISLAGELRMIALTSAAISTSVGQFQFGAPPLGCGSATMATIALAGQPNSGLTVLHASASIENSGTVPLHLCQWSVENDPFGAFPAANITIDAEASYIHFSIDIAVPSDAYYALAPPYPLDLLIRTTGGTRLLRIAPPPQIDQETILQLQAEVLSIVADCYQERQSPFKDFGIYEFGIPEVVLPATTLEHTLHVVVTGLPAGEIVSLSSGGAVLSAGSSASSLVSFSATVNPGALLSIGKLPSHRSVGSDSGAESTNENTASSDEQFVLLHQVVNTVGEVPLADSCIQLVSSPFGGERTVLAILESSIMSFDFSNPAIPRRLNQWRTRGVHGVVPFRQALLGYGENGLVRLLPAGSFEPVSGIEPDSIRAAVSSGDWLYLLSDQGIAVISNRLRQFGSLPIEGGTSMIRLRGQLLIGNQSGVVTVSLSDPARPQIVEILDTGSVHQLRRTRGAGSPLAIAVLDDGSAVVVNHIEQSVAMRDKLNEWPAPLQRLTFGRWQLSTSNDRRSLVVGEVVHSSLL